MAQGSWTGAAHSQLRFHYMTPSLLANSLGSSDSCSSESTLFIYRYIYLVVIIYFLNYFYLLLHIYLIFHKNVVDLQHLFIYLWKTLMFLYLINTC